MNLGTKIFAFVQGRNTMVVKAPSLYPAGRYVCSRYCKGNITVERTEETLVDCFCDRCGQVYLLVITGKK